MQETTTVLDEIEEALLSTPNDKEHASIHYIAKRALQAWWTAQQKLDERTASYPGNVYDWDMLNTLVEADVQIKFVAQVMNASSDADNLTFTDEGFQAVLGMRYRSLLDNRGGTSTDKFSNAIDHTEAEFNSRMVRDFYTAK